jgi:hypothetical protein
MFAKPPSVERVRLRHTLEQVRAAVARLTEIKTQADRDREADVALARLAADIAVRMLVGFSNQLMGHCMRPRTRRVRRRKSHERDGSQSGRVSMGQGG